MELVDYFRVLRDHWIAVTAAVVACAVAAFIYNTLQPLVYVASSSAFVTSGPGDDPNYDNINDVLAKSRAASYVALANDRETAILVIDDLGLDTTPEALIGNIVAAQTPETVLVNVTARAGTPVAAKDLADAWISALAERVSDVESTSDEEGPRLEVTGSALLPTESESPRVERNVILGAVLGALLGIAYAYSRALMDRRLISLERVESASGVVVIGEIPEIPGAAGLFVARRGTSPSTRAAEEVRRLRTNLSYTDVEGQPRSIVVTSANHGEGKTTVAMNLAAAIALTGQTVILVDADLRGSGSGLAAACGLHDEDGLADVLAGDLNWDDALHQDTDVVGLSVLTAGHRPSNPSEVLGSVPMRSLVQELSARSIVVIDCPPLLPVTDAAVIARIADGALVVVSSGSTRDNDLKTAMEHLLVVHARPLGVVVNHLPRRVVRASRSHYRRGTDPLVAGDSAADLAGSGVAATARGKGHRAARRASKVEHQASQT